MKKFDIPLGPQDAKLGAEFTRDLNDSKVDVKSDAKVRILRSERYIQVGKKAPGFTALNDENKSIALTDFLGKSIILYFYPKDDTPGCTQEACDFRDSLAELSTHGVVVIGISKDSVKSHQKFKEKYQLPFILLADVNKEICQAYQVMVEKSRYGKKYLGIDRSTFLIDAQGIIKNIWRNVKVEGHVKEILGSLCA